MAKNLEQLNKQQLIELVRQLIGRVEELERENARLKKNSSTSSKPPSSDIVKPASKPAKGKGAQAQDRRTARASKARAHAFYAGATGRGVGLHLRTMSRLCSKTGSDLPCRNPNQSVPSLPMNGL
jgi:Family of unknown function (DUF6444)